MPGTFVARPERRRAARARRSELHGAARAGRHPGGAPGSARRERATVRGVAAGAVLRAARVLEAGRRRRRRRARLEPTRRRVDGLGRRLGCRSAPHEGLHDPPADRVGVLAPGTGIPVGQKVPDVHARDLDGKDVVALVALREGPDPARVLPRRLVPVLQLRDPRAGDRVPRVPEARRHARSRSASTRPTPRRRRRRRTRSRSRSSATATRR